MKVVDTMIKAWFDFDNGYTVSLCDYISEFDGEHHLSTSIYDNELGKELFHSTGLPKPLTEETAKEMLEFYLKDLPEIYKASIPRREKRNDEQL